MPWFKGELRASVTPISPTICTSSWSQTLPWPQLTPWGHTDCAGCPAWQGAPRCPRGRGHRRATGPAQGKVGFGLCHGAVWLSSLHPEPKDMKTPHPSVCCTQGTGHCCSPWAVLRTQAEPRGSDQGWFQISVCIQCPPQSSAAAAEGPSPQGTLGEHFPPSEGKYSRSLS